MSAVKPITPYQRLLDQVHRAWAQINYPRTERINLSYPLTSTWDNRLRGSIEVANTIGYRVEVFIEGDTMKFRMVKRPNERVGDFTFTGGDRP